MGLLTRFLPWRRRNRYGKTGDAACCVPVRRCRFEHMEPRRVLSANPLYVGAVYIEEDAGSDLHGDTFQISFEGGAPGTELKRIVINGDQGTPGFGVGDVFFDTQHLPPSASNNGFGADEAFPFSIVSRTGIDRVTAQVIDGTSLLILEFEGFHAGEKLVFSIDVDEVEDFDPAETNITIINDGFDPITSGVEFQGSKFQVEFTAPHYRDISGQAEFRNRYDDNFAGSGLKLPADDDGGKRDRSAGAIVSLQQVPKPVTIAGRVYHDTDLDLVQDAGEAGIANVTLELWRKEGASYVATGHSVKTNASGDYRFDESLNLLPGVYQVRETQPAGYFSVGATAGTVDGKASGATVAGNRDALTEIDIPLGDLHAVNYNFAEAQAARISGYVYHDRDNDSVRDAGEEGVAGAQIQIVPVSTIASQATITVQTNAAGFYDATGLAPGTYRVVEIVQPAGYLDGLDRAGTVNGQTRGAAVNPGDAINSIFLGGNQHGVEYNFGELRPAEIHGSVTLTTPDGDCFVEGAERRPVANVRIQLFDATGALVAETTTNANGDYSFLGLRPGVYRVVEHTPAGLIDGGDHIGTVGGAVRGALVANDQIGGITLASGEIGRDYDFCEHEPAQISGFVFHDKNQSGVRDSGDEPIAGVTVTLYDANGAQVGQTTSAADGSYAFRNLRKGQYKIVESHPAGWIDGPDSAGKVANVVVGQAVNPGDEVRNIALKWGDAGVNYNFGEYRPASISGYVYHDRDNDGVRETGEEGLAGVQIRVEPINVLSPQAPRTVTTDANGFYQVTGLAPGTYRVVEAAQPATFVDGRDAAGTVNGQVRGAAVNPGDKIENVTLNTGDNGFNYNFGEYRTAEIHGHVRLSTPEGDCFVEGDDAPPLEGVVVRLFDSTGNLLSQTKTDVNGRYSFTGLLPGTYTVVEETPAGLIDGDEHVGAVNGAARGVILGNDRIGNIALTSGEIGEHYDFCEHLPASVSGYVYHDQNQNGGRDSGEEAIAGVTIRLLDSTGAVVATTTTNSQGFYQFQNLRLGQYTIIETHPAGWIDGPDDAGTVNGVTVGAAVNPGDEIRAVALKWGDNGVNYNFGEYRPTVLSGYVYHDRNNNGVRESGEEGLSGVAVRVTPVNTLASQAAVIVVTRADGYYEATGLAPGGYRVEEVQQPDTFVDGLDSAGTVAGQTRGTAVNPGDRIENITLNTGERGVNYNFGEYRRAEIRGHVRLSTPDGDCFVEGEESRPVENAVIRLYDSTGKLLAETKTNAAGEYRFGDLLPGTYTVVEETPAGLLDGDEHVGTVRGVEVGALGGDDTIRDILLTSGDVGENYDFCEHLPAAIAGYVYHDRDNDGRREAGEEGLAGVTLQIVPVNALAPQQTVTVTTDANGFYRADRLLPGAYRIVQATQPAGFNDGLDTAGDVGGVIRGVAINPGDRIEDVTLKTGDQGLEYNFGEIKPAEIHGRVQLTTPDGDCFVEGVETPPLANVTIRLLDESGNLLAVTKTNAAGEYRFTGLLPGVYTVVEETPEGLIDGGEHVGTLGGVVLGNDTLGSIRLMSGDVGRNYDFCEHEPASLSGYVYHDQNNNGRRDAGELAIPGVSITLADEAGQTIATTTTNAQGLYEFSGLRAGSYVVREAQPEGWIDGLDAAGTIGGIVIGAATNPGDAISAITLKWGDNGLEYNFGELRPVSISGYVYHDRDNDGRREAGEEGLAGVAIQVMPVDGGSLQAPVTVHTNADGFYLVTGLAPGAYRVVEVSQPSDFIDGTDVAGTVAGAPVGQAVNPGDRIEGVVLASGQSGIDYNFGEYQLGEIRGQVRLTTPEGDCFVEGVETPPVVGATVRLYDSAGNEVDVTQTDANGQYRFTALLPGRYTVVEETPAGLIDGGEHVGGGGGVANGRLDGNDRITDILMTSGQLLVGYDFCEHEPATLAGFVYHDRNNDGRRDDGEEPIAGVTVILRDAEGNEIARRQSDAQGAYRFTDLRAGEYMVTESHPAGWLDGLDTPGTIDGAVTGVANQPGDAIRNVVLKWGSDGVEYNFGELRPATIEGMVHTDPDRDLEFDDGELPLAGVRIVLLNDNGGQVAETATDAQGRYRFDGLAPGRYTVVESQPAGYFNGDQKPGTTGGDGSVENVISGVTVASGQTSHENNFLEVPPAVISGRVFQDGEAIISNDGSVPENLRDLRDGVFTPDDTPLPGVTLELRNGINGEPIDASAALPGYYVSGPIRVVTDANGYYEFRGLAPGNYAVFQVHPDGYIDSLDSPGTLQGFAFNVGEVVPAFVINTLSVNPHNDAIVRIILPSGAHAQNNNFSEVRVRPLFAPPPTNAPETPAPELAVPTPAPVIAPVVLPPPLVPPRQEVGFTGGGETYTWHLSVVNAGAPRGDAWLQPAGNSPWRQAGYQDDPQWSRELLQSGVWVFLGQQSGRITVQEQETQQGVLHRVFGLTGAIPIAGDWDGDGVSELGVFYKGQWFLDLNGNGEWDPEDLWAQLGDANDRPVVGDWDGDGKDDIGIFGPMWPGDPRAIRHEPGIPDAQNRLAVRTPHNNPKNVPPEPEKATDGERQLQRSAQGRRREDLIDHVFQYGSGRDIPVTGDWNGDGIDTIGVFRDGEWTLDTDGDGVLTPADTIVQFGAAGDMPVVGDWNGDGVDEVGVFRDGRWQLDSNGNRELDAHDRVFELGAEGDRPAVGDWDGDGADEPAIYRDAATQE